MPYVDVNQEIGKANWHNIQIFGGILPIYVNFEPRTALLKSRQSSSRDL
jgi:hypothetical protein